MDQAGSPEKLPKLPITPTDEIPEALRETPEPRRSLRLKPMWLISGGLGVGAIALLAGTLLSGQSPQSEVASSSESPTGIPTPQQSPTPTASEQENLLGHLPYEEAPESDLQAITTDGRIQLRTAAANKFLEMRSAAQADGAILVPLSGFRSASEQESLFFEVKEQRGQVTTKRAEVSAPPGYSEHHTGFAIDIGDGRASATHLSPSFEKTAAFDWLEKNAPRYSFELSFPRDNPQGISYEPWHWRFVGNLDSLETFYRARDLDPSASQRESDTPQPESEQ